MNCEYDKTVEKWGVFEVTLHGRTDGNPFKDHTLKGTFTGEKECVSAEGFYDGDGVYKVRFMPRFTGGYTFRIEGSALEEAAEGGFTVTEAAEGNHGPVHVKDTFHFAYDDGTPYYPVGTTCYVWELQSEELQKKTIETLSKGYFNKIRFCVFPKHYDYNQHEPRSYPFGGTPMDSSVLTSDNFNEYTGDKGGNAFDFDRFNPEHFRHIEACILELQKLGIEADLILMHPYDRWGFSLMDHAHDLYYLKYAANRFAAFRNVWWSFANEWDLMPQKSVDDWEDFAKTVMAHDPYDHLRNIHNCTKMYDQTAPWITHVCAQRIDVYKHVELVDQYREQFQKPIIMDEIAYEGNIQHGWGNISGQELVRRFWECTVRGGYGGHGETYLSDDRILWWSHGGELKGESQDRLKFLAGILAQTPGLGLKHIHWNWDDAAAVPEQERPEKITDYSYYLFYYGFFRPSFREFSFPEGRKYKAEVIDTWNMTVTELPETFSGRFKIPLPGHEYMAVRLRRTEE